MTTGTEHEDIDLLRAELDACRVEIARLRDLTSATPAARTVPPRVDALPGSGRSGHDPTVAGEGVSSRHPYPDDRPGRPTLDRLLPWLLCAGWGGLAVFGWIVPASRPAFLVVCVVAGLVAFIASADRGER